MITSAKRPEDIDQEDAERFAAPGWGTLDLTAGWRPLEGLELRFGAFNLGDKTYWRWLDVAKLDASDPLIPVLARPGRNFSVSASVQF